MSRVVNPRIAGVDDTKDPHIWWQLLDLDNETFMAAYVAGELVVAHPDTGAPAIWRKGHREPLPDRVVDRLRAIWPAGEGLHPYPGHEILTSAAAWPADPTAARLSHRPASAIEVAPPTWLWPRWLVAGAVQLLVGRQGSGKSTFAAWVVAQLSTGR
ncbi:MAG: AAA family ATPase, partial [Acidimicrobiaceae bacterium]|nr:AAA family ATPase [Acidimicrobiaceae bacterium]